MRTIRWGLLVLGASILARDTAVAQSSAPSDSTVDVSLEARVERLDQELRVFKRLRELERESTATAARTRVAITAGAEGFSVRSADGKYQLRLRGYAQSDTRVFVDDGAAPGTNAFLLRRVRPIVEATVGRYFEFRIMPDFAGGQVTLFDGYWEGRFHPAFSVRAGKFKPPAGLERLQSATDLAFAERALPTNLVPSRDVGVQVHGEVGQGLLAYQVGVFDGVADLGSGDGDVSDAKDFAGRIVLQPFRRGPLRGLGLGVAGTTGIERASATAPALAAYRTPGQQTFFRYRGDGTTTGTVFADGRRRRLAPQGYFYSGPFGFLGEYTLSWQDVRLGATTTRLKHRAWQATGTLFLTGERASFRSVAPKRPFDLAAHTYGAVELVARYGALRLDDDAFPTFANPAAAAREAEAWAVGANWHLTRAVKLAVSYEQTTFDGGAAAATDRANERFFVTRLQHAF